MPYERVIEVIDGDTLGHQQKQLGLRMFKLQKEALPIAQWLEIN
jgi:hypothetical protein